MQTGSFSTALMAIVGAVTEPQTTGTPARWIVERETASCGLSVKQDHPAAGPALIYRRWLGLTGTGLTLSRNALPGGHSGATRGSITLLPGRRTFAFAAGQFADTPADSLSLYVEDAGFRAALARSTGVRLALDGSPPLELSLGDVRNVNAQLQACEEDWLREIGIDPVAVVEPPDELRSAAAASADYPPSAVRAGAQGRAVAAVAFDRDGRASRCRVIAGTGDAALDEASCRMALRLRLGADKQRSAERYVLLPVFWRLP